MRFQFNIRSLFAAMLLLTALLAVGHQQRQLHQLREKLRTIDTEAVNSLQRLEVQHQRLLSEHNKLRRQVENPTMRLRPLALN